MVFWEVGNIIISEVNSLSIKYNIIDKTYFTMYLIWFELQNINFTTIIIYNKPNKKAYTWSANDHHRKKLISCWYNKTHNTKYIFV